MTACLFGTYNRGHTANRTYATAIRAAGYRLVEYHVPLWERTRDKDAAYFSPLALFAHALEYTVAALRLSAAWLMSGGTPVAVVGFNGQLDVLLLRLLSGRRRPRIVFAPLVSLTETLVDDRGLYRPGSLMARLLAALDRLSCSLADVVVADTEAHRRYYIERLGVEEARVTVCHLGPDTEKFAGAEQLTAGGGKGKLEVLWFGQYLPLHGLDVIADAVARLAPRADLRFTFIGTGPERDHIEPLLRAARADIEFVDWVPYENLAARIAEADLVLGIFGNSAKATMVIPNKVYAAAAMGRAVVTADTVAVGELFTSERDILMCRADGKSLAAAVARLADDNELRASLGARAADLMASRFAPAQAGMVWRRVLSGEAHAARAGAEDRLGVAILNFNDAAATLRCLETVVAADYENLSVLVVDNGSQPADLAALEAGMAGRFGARLLPLPGNLGYAGANNKALELLFAGGCDHVLVLNNDTLVVPGSLAALVAAARRYPGAGPIGPTVTKDSPGARNASRGERYWAALAWLPRSLLRYRLPRASCYEVGGVMGCALLVSRRLWTALGGFDESYFAYYEEVDYCLRARSRGMRPRVEPSAEVAHRGHRGFGGGMSVVSAYLKARNLWRLVRPRLGYASMPVFVFGYLAMATTSALIYLARGRAGIAKAMLRGALAGLRGDGGPPPAWTLAR